MIKKMLAIAVIAFTAALGASAQEGSETMVTRSVAELKDALLNGPSSEKTTALTEWENLAKTDAIAAFELAQIYRTGSDATGKDLVAAADLYRIAGEAGNADAWRILGDLYRRSEDPALDPTLALSNYEKGEAIGDIESSYRLGEYYRTGTGGAVADAPTALAKYRIAADAGFQPSYLKLADLLKASGNSGDAFTWYQKAADAGTANAYFALGELYRKGEGVQANLETAASFYQSAVDKGVSKAALPLANLYLTGQLGRNEQEKGLALLRSASAENISGARVALAYAYFRGTGTTKSIQSGLDVLREGVDASDTTAARQLVRVYTEGRPEGVRKDVASAEQVLASVFNQLDDRAKSYETLIIQAARSSSLLDLENVNQLFSKLEDRDKSSALIRTYVLNPNVFVALIQSALKEREIFSGSVNGRLTASTIQAVNAFCDDAGIANECRFGPLRPDTRTSLARQLFP